MTRQEAYKILNIPETSNADEIKQAYKKQAKKYHPDLYQGDKKFAEEKMKQINEAYELLNTPNTSTTNTSSSNNSKTSYDYYSSQAEQEARRRAEEAQRRYEEEMLQKLREENERIAKKLEEQIKQSELAAKKMRKIAQPILISLFFVLEVYLIKLLTLAINSIQLYFSQTNWFFFGFWILLGILAVIFNIGIPIGFIWLVKKAKIFKRTKK